MPLEESHERLVDLRVRLRVVVQQSVLASEQGQLSLQQIRLWRPFGKATILFDERSLNGYGRCNSK